MMDAFAYCKMVYDKQGRPVNFIYVAVNNAFEKLMGLSKEQIVGKRESEIMLQTKDGKTELFEVYGRVADTRKAEKLESYSNLLGIWLSIKVYSPQKGHFIAQFEDITEQVTMRKKLEDYAEHLEALVKDRTNKLREAERLTTIGQIAGMVGHDIRTPLQAINSNIYLLKNYISSISDLDVRRDMTESLADIENNVEYITEITADLQDYADP
jgi:PAS domain S-box-containing protein